MDKVYLFTGENGLRYIINIQFSKIGYGYPRFFIESGNGNCYNFDLTVAVCFKMKQKDFNDWASDARTDREFSSVCEEIGLGHATDKIIAVIREVQEG